MKTRLLISFLVLLILAGGLFIGGFFSLNNTSLFSGNYAGTVLNKRVNKGAKKKSERKVKPLRKRQEVKTISAASPINFQGKWYAKGYPAMGIYYFDFRDKTVCPLATLDMLGGDETIGEKTTYILVPCDSSQYHLYEVKGNILTIAELPDFTRIYQFKQKTQDIIEMTASDGETKFTLIRIPSGTTKLTEEFIGQ